MLEGEPGPLFSASLLHPPCRKSGTFCCTLNVSFYLALADVIESGALSIGFDRVSMCNVWLTSLALADLAAGVTALGWIPSSKDRRGWWRPLRCAAREHREQKELREGK